MFVIIFLTFSSEVLLMQQSCEFVTLEWYLITDCRLYLLAGFGRLMRRDFAKFQKKFLKILEIERVS